MAYPKPLSANSLDRLYRQSGISARKMKFIRTLVGACANLYGAFFAWEAWEVYKELSEKTATVKIARKELYHMLAIMRREPDNKFYVFEVDEVYKDDKRKTSNMIVALKEIIGTGYRKYDNLWRLLENSCGKPFFVPENLLEYVKMPEDPYETKFLHELENLKSNKKMLAHPLFGNKKRNKNAGKRLKDFSFVSLSDELQLDLAEGKYGTKPKPKEVERLKAKIYSMNAAERIVNDFKWEGNLGFDSPNQAADDMIENLEAASADIKDINHLNHLLQLASDMQNHRHLWCNHGWSPIGLREYLGPVKNPIVKIGPGLKQAFKEGVIDEDEYKATLRKAGFKILGEDVPEEEEELED